MKERSRAALHRRVGQARVRRSFARRIRQSVVPTQVDTMCGAICGDGERRGAAVPLDQAMTVLVRALEAAAT